MDPLTTLIQSQRHHIHQQQNRSAPRRSSAGEETVNSGRTARPRNRVAVAYVVGVLILFLTVLATLALV
jgi:hypothetical protein